jgi:hypothetical protein
MAGVHSHLDQRSGHAAQPGLPSVADYPLLDALRGRRSRRFGRGMRMEHGPLAFTSSHPPLPLGEDEEALLAYAACGITGYALADLEYARGRGGTMLAGWAGRTIGSGDAIQTVALIVINDEATYLLKRPRDFAAHDVAELIRLSDQGEYADLYRRTRVKIKDGRVTAPVEPLYNFNINKWALYAPGSTYFLPVNDLTFLYINALLEVFDEETGGFIRDERRGYRPAGLARFARSKGGHLHDDPDMNRTGTIQRIEAAFAEATTFEQGMMLQNLGLMAQAIGLGGFMHFAAHEFGWLRALGFRTRQIPTSQYLGIRPVLGAVARALGKDKLLPLVLGLERGGEVLLKPFCPPYYDGMEAAVHAVVDAKFGPRGAYREGTRDGAWQEPAAIAAGTERPSAKAIDATVAYCEYVFKNYGRFPAYSPPYKTFLGYQATHVDEDFYARFYRPEALTETQREHVARWHGPRDA